MGNKILNRRLRLLLLMLLALILPAALYTPPKHILAVDDSLSLNSQLAAMPTLNWWDVNWSYRVPITIDAAGYARDDKPVDVAINFADLLFELGVSGTVDQDSLYLHEVDGDGIVITANVPFQYDPPSEPTAPSSLTILMEGTTAADVQRHYHLYFDIEGSGVFTPQTVTPLVSISDNVLDASLASYKIQTNAATYYYHKDGGGFSSLIDKDGIDWISYSSDSGSAGDFRGIPNLVHPADGGYFHPGRAGVVSSVISDGPLKVVIHSQTADKAWETAWEIYPDFARLTVLKAATNYWFLYEGTPGGVLEMDTDLVVRSDGTQTTAGTPWTGDITPEWLFFGDPNVDRSLFFAHHEDDPIVDSYYPLNGEMTVFGFGREGSSRFLSQVPSHFTLGFEDGVEIAALSSAIHSAYKDLSVTVALPESQPPYSLLINKQGNGDVTVDPDQAEYAYGEEAVLQAIAAPGWAFIEWTGNLTGVDPNPTIVFKSNKQITAVFKEKHELAVDIEGKGKVTVDPVKTYYLAGEEVTLEAIADPGWRFKEWTGDLTGQNLKPTIEISGDTQISAVFEQEQYALTIAAEGGGQVIVDPVKANYLYKDKVTLEAVADVGWTFKEWKGDLTGVDQRPVIEITEDVQITAVFEQIQFTLTIEKTGMGAVLKSPDKESYLYGEEVVIEAIPAKGWVFREWGGDISGDDKIVYLTIKDNHAVHAHFKEAKYYLPVILGR